MTFFEITDTYIKIFETFGTNAVWIPCYGTKLPTKAIHGSKRISSKKIIEFQDEL